jgi:hypothetical protein
MNLKRELQHLQEHMKSLLVWCEDLQHPADYCSAQNALTAIGTQTIRVAFALSEDEARTRGGMVK